MPPCQPYTRIIRSDVQAIQCCAVLCVCGAQIPLDQILTTQRDVLALQHVIQREVVTTHSRLQAVAGGTAAAAAQQPPPLLPPDFAAGGGGSKQQDIWLQSQLNGQHEALLKAALLLAHCIVRSLYCCH